MMLTRHKEEVSEGRLRTLAMLLWPCLLLDVEQYRSNLWAVAYDGYLQLASDARTFEGF